MSILPRRLVPLLLPILASSLLSQEATETKAALKGLDPVALVRGEETPGERGLAIERGGYRYHFASEDSRTEFTKDPERYEIQLGGTCARMGALSGRGGSDRFWVYKERIYVFASDQCREGFKKAADRLLAVDESAPESTEAERGAGATILTSAFEAHGGALIDKVQSIRATRKWEEKNQEQVWQRLDSRLVSFPSSFRTDSCWGDAYRYRHVSTPAASFSTSNDKSEDLHASGARELKTSFLRWPLVLLRARKDPGFSAFHRESAKAEDRDVALVTVAYDKTTTVLGIDKENGRIHSATFRGRGPSSAFGLVVESYSDFRATNGILLPFTISTTFDGKPEPKLSWTWTSIEVDATLPVDTFKRS